MIFFNNRKQTLFCRLAVANSGPQIYDLIVRLKTLNHPIIGIPSVIVMIYLAALSNVYAEVEDLRGVDINSVYLDVTYSDKLRSGIVADYLANHISEGEYFDNIISQNFGANSSYGDERIQVPSEPIFMTNTGIPSAVWNIGLGDELTYPDEPDTDGASAAMGGGDYGYSLLANLRLGSDLPSELFGVAKNSTGPLSLAAPGPEVAGGGCGNPIKMKGIQKCQRDGGPIDGKSASGNGQATENQSSAKIMTTDSGEDDVALSLPIGSALYISPTFWLWRGCADAYCNAVMDSLTAVEAGSTSSIEPTPIPESLIVDPLDPPDPPNFDPLPDTPPPEFAPTPATSVPEPSTLILVSLGFLCMALALRKRAAQKCAW